MNIIQKLRKQLFKKPASYPVESGSPSTFEVTQISKFSENDDYENPYLNARRTWNYHMDSLVSDKRMWQLMGLGAIFMVCIVLKGYIDMAGQSSVKPYMVTVDKNGQTLAVGPIEASQKATQVVMHAALAKFIIDARTVTADAALQQRMSYEAFAYVNTGEQAATFLTDWFVNNKPSERAKTELVTVAIRTVLPQTNDTWQVEWVETATDRKGSPTAAPVTMRALMTVYQAEINNMSEEQLRFNPFNLHLRTLSWAAIK